MRWLPNIIRPPLVDLRQEAGPSRFMLFIISKCSSFISSFLECIKGFVLAKSESVQTVTPSSLLWYLETIVHLSLPTKYRASLLSLFQSSSLGLLIALHNSNSKLNFTSILTQIVRSCCNGSEFNCSVAIQVLRSVITDALYSRGVYSF